MDMSEIYYIAGPKFNPVAPTCPADWLARAKAAGVNPICASLDPDRLADAAARVRALGLQIALYGHTLQPATDDVNCWHDMAAPIPTAADGIGLVCPNRWADWFGDPAVDGSLARLSLCVNACHPKAVILDVEAADPYPFYLKRLAAAGIAQGCRRCPTEEAYEGGRRQQAAAVKSAAGGVPVYASAVGGPVGAHNWWPANVFSANSANVYFASHPSIADPRTASRKTLAAVAAARGDLVWVLMTAPPARLNQIGLGMHDRGNFRAGLWPPPGDLDGSQSPADQITAGMVDEWLLRYRAFEAGLNGRIVW
jgi:hypothetical protein